jgi:uncharacterized protein (TIGR02145 family)
MSFKCNVGLHSWDGCTCKECGKVRDEEHDLTLDCEKCARCGKVIEDGHNWSHDCEKCSVCGKTREHQHSWIKDCEKCSKCGQARQNIHKMVNGICQVCGNGEYIDETDKKKYKTVRIGDHVVMAQNFARHSAKGRSWAYDDTEVNADKYGLLYDWETAKNIAPKGWHIPTKDEWENLHSFLGGNDKEVFEQLRLGGLSGFDGIYGGFRTVKGAYTSLGASGEYWSASSEDESHVYYFKVGAYTSTARIEKGEPALGLSLRLFRDK